MTYVCIICGQVNLDSPLPVVECEKCGRPFCDRCRWTHAERCPFLYQEDTLEGRIERITAKYLEETHRAQPSAEDNHEIYAWAGELHIPLAVFFSGIEHAQDDAVVHGHTPADFRRGCSVWIRRGLDAARIRKEAF